MALDRPNHRLNHKSHILFLLKRSPYFFSIAAAGL
ncbi:hypothetical protein COLO4_33314 [Corchorus olitorius]|uniref:Uncharacterized protein n=1 Tax=Corchorus olitorius TaxID=93759 RepID=A0A1R3GUR6_9ROSI|nr:hypothetical protein COLO4_33314 [Corchorus olitorius]